MEEIFDIERYTRGLRQRWWLIVGLALLGVVVAAVLSLVLPKTYQATTRILVTTPKLRAQFDSRLLSTTDLGLNRDLHRTFVSLARTRDLEDQVRERLGDEVPPELRPVGKLRDMISVTQLEGTSALYELTARGRDPAFVQELASVWAEEYVSLINNLYGLSSESKTDLDADLVKASEHLSQAEKALRAFQGRTGVGLVDNIQYPATLSRKAGLTQRQNLFGLYERYGAQGTTLQAKSTTLGLYQAALDDVNLVLAAASEQADTAPASKLPLELLSQSDVLTQRLNLDRLEDGTVGTVKAALEGERSRLEDTIRRLQADLEELTLHLSEQSQELATLVRDQALAEETYIILSLKQSENQTQAAVADSWMEIVDSARLPDKPVSPNLPLNVLSGGLLGALLGILGALLLVWLGR